MDYRLAVEHDSMFNTPPTFAWFAAEVFAWLKSTGGISSVTKINQQKAQMLYQCIDGNAFYRNGVVAANRSQMNVTFQLVNEALDSEF